MKKFIYCFHVWTRPHQIQRLISRLDAEDVIFVINVSKCSNIKDFSFKTNHNNLFYVNDDLSVKVFWGGISQVQQTINSFKWIRENITTDYSHVHLLRESEYILKPPSKIKEFYFNNPDKSYFKFSKIDVESKWKQPV